MTVSLVTNAALLVIIFSAALTPLVAHAFCVRPAPRGLRTLRDLALAVAISRAFAVNVDGRPPEWWGALAWWTLAGFGLSILAFNIWAAIGPMKDRCGHSLSGDGLERESSR